MVNSEGLMPEETPLTEIEGLFKEFPHPVVEFQAVKEYPDGTEIVIGNYDSVEHGGTEQVFNMFSVYVRRGDNGISFSVTQNGLVDVSINRRVVSLRSLLHSRPGENLRIRFNDPIEEAKLRSPRDAFRAAAGPLAQWIKDIDAGQKYTPPPVSIVEKVSRA